MHAFAGQLNAKVTRHTVESTLKKHPDYPSLFSLSHALGQWQIENVALQLQPEQFTELTAPFIAHIHHEGEPGFALVQSIRNGTVEWSCDPQKRHREPVDQFIGRWTGVALLAEATPGAGEEKYRENRTREMLDGLRLPFVMAVVAVCLLTGLYSGTAAGVSWPWYALLLLKCLGVTLGGLLLWQSIDKDNPVIARLCRPGKKINCNSVLDSPPAKLWGWLGWAEIGFLYFSGGLLALLLGSSPTGAVLLAAFNLLALPFTFYSVYYQARIVRQWCALCLGAVAILWLEFFAGLALWRAFWQHAFPWHEPAKLLVAFAVPAAGWALVKPVLLSARKTRRLEDELRRFKYNPDLLVPLLEQQPVMPPAEDLQPIMLGNAEAGQVITLVTNPYCPPCAKAHAEIEELLAGNPNLKCRIIFSGTNQENDRKGKAARYLLSLPGHEQARALKEWFAADEKARAGRLNQPRSRAAEERARQVLDDHARWCEEAAITATPTIYLNQHRLPELYRLSDLAPILPYLPQPQALAC
ncbi:MAG: thioredoxin domain-containing protein [Cytophagales bacterium]|nr:thioredoxin domain-containing protein [Cytophagales bacterium]